MTLHSCWVTILTWLLNVLVFLSILVSLEHVRHVLLHIWVKLKGYLHNSNPEDKFAKKPLPDVIKASSSFPRVAVQLPMFNERAVCEGLIDCACSLSWPASKLKVQVLDDSDDWKTKQLVDSKVLDWRKKGANIDLVRRTHRQGYKAGALRQGMESLQDYDYVAVFDADFRPDHDFLIKAVPYLEGNPRVCLVQARWVFTNSGESLLTKAQQLALNYHFKCEQLVHFATGSFFNFNGTAGVWRTKAINEVGGWYSRTTVEDMDLSLRTFLAQWQAVYLEDLTCRSELPASLFAYRKQQHRWTCGPMQLLRKILPEVVRSKQPWHRKLDVLYCYFGIGKFLTHIVCLTFYCTLLPLTVLTPGVHVPTWALFQMPLLCTICTCIYTSRGWQYSLVYVVFQNAMAVVKLWAVVSGVFGLHRANEWIVTTKLGSCSKKEGVEMNVPSSHLYPTEFFMGVFMLLSACIGIAKGQQVGIACFLLLHGTAFIAFGTNLVDHRCNLGKSSKPDVAAKYLLQKVVTINAVAASLPSFSRHREFGSIV